MSTSKWKAIAPSNFPWEREALDFVREHLPDRDPYRAWSNFEFISEDGTINEVDLLVLTPQGFFLVEIKSRPGIISGDAMTWVWNREGRITTDDNPLLLANRKAKRLISLLKNQSACRKIRVPYLEPLIFSSHPESQCQLQGIARNRLCLRDKVATGDKPARRGIIAALMNRDFEGANENARPLVDKPIAKAISNAMEQAGIRPSNRARRVGDYVLGELLYDSPTGTYQDWLATHSAIEKSKRRIRIYNTAGTTSESVRETIRKAARREFELLETINHRGILRVEGFTEHELGPALIFRHDPTAIRLDHFLSQYASRINVDMRLSLLRQISEALSYAHEKRIVHRALSPQSILVTEPESSSPTTQIFNWQIAYRDSSSSTKDGSRLTATSHPEQLVENAATAYMAPEATSDPAGLGEHVDIFSVGAIAYHIFSGQTPAASGVELAQKIRDGKGLQISSVVDGVGKELQDLIQLSTHPEVSNRLDTVSDFLELLDAVEEELTKPERDRNVAANPLEARIGDTLQGGFEVKSHLGSGSSSKAYLVQRDGKEFVLKIAISSDHNERITAEAETLRKLHHQNIVQAYDTVNVGGLVGFTMQRAGEKTLAQRLRAEGRLHLDLLERFGEDLLQAIMHLEESGFQHRDIKPENIGVRPLGKNETPHLVLFDFSLSRTPADNIRAGTTAYLDPFLSLRNPPRWDLAAERYAATVTLYEMATGTLPKWGDGRSSPEVLDCEATLSPELYDPELRDAMIDFFAKALRRDYRERFDNTNEILRAWREIFEGIAPQPASEISAVESVDSTVLDSATLATPLTALGLSTRAANAIDRINVISVKDLLRVPQGKIRSLPGVGNRTRVEIAKLASQLRTRFADEAKRIQPATTTDTDGEGAEPQVASVDLIAQQVATFTSRHGTEEDKNILYALIGWKLIDKSDVYAWPSHSQVTGHLGVSHARVTQVLTKARERWRRNPSVTALRQSVAEIVEANSRVMTADELGTTVLMARGSGEEEPIRSQFASMVLRVAVETERMSDEPRFIYRRAGKTVIIAGTSDLADYVERLGKEADSLADLDPIATPARLVERLRSIALGEGMAPLTDARLVKLGSAASTHAAVSSRMELYPKGMEAVRALRLAHGALFGADELTIEEIRRRVEGRYPEAEKLPGRPALDQLLTDVGVDLNWDTSAGGGIGAYRSPQLEGVSGLSSSTSHFRYPTVITPAGSATVAEVSPDIADARVFENKLRRANKEGAFLALMTPPRDLLRAEKELTRRFDLCYNNFDQVLISVMREQALGAGADWDKVLRADAAPHDGQEWRNLQILVSRCMPIVEQQLSESEKTVLLTYPGLLARYGRLDFLEKLRDRVGTPHSKLHGLWLLLPSDDQSALPMLNGKPVPIISSGQWAHIPETWISNVHRSDNGHAQKSAN